MNVVLDAANLWAVDEGYNIDPLLAEPLAASVVIFTGNYCYQPNTPVEKQVCNSGVMQPEFLRPFVGTFLKESLARPAKLESLASRLARSVGGNIEDTGWDPLVSNPVAEVTLPDSIRGRDLSMVTSSGRSSIGPARKAILTIDGPYAVSVAGDGDRVIRASASPNRPSALVLSAVGAAIVASRPTRIEAEPSSYCQTSVMRTTPRTQPFNSGRATFVESTQVRENNRTAVSKTIGLDIRIVDETAACDRLCKDSLAFSFARAIALWRSGCIRCDSNSLSVLRIGQTVWLDSRAAARARDQRFLRGELTAAESSDKVTFGDGGSRLSAPSLGPPLTFIAGYDEITGDPRFTSEICIAPVDSTDWMQVTRDFVCSQPSRSSLHPRILAATVRLVTGSTECGPSADFLACGLPGRGIEISLDGISYAMRVPGRADMITLGAFSEVAPMDAVIVHEVGHWFGVPHMLAKDAPLDVMADTIGDGAFCISAASLAMLNNASDIRWPYRVEKGGGLRRSRVQRSLR